MGGWYATAYARGDRPACALAAYTVGTPTSVGERKVVCMSGVPLRPARWGAAAPPLLRKFAHGHTVRRTSIMTRRTTAGLRSGRRRESIGGGPTKTKQLP